MGLMVSTASVSWLIRLHHEGSSLLTVTLHFESEPKVRDVCSPQAGQSPVIKLPADCKVFEKLIPHIIRKIETL